MKYFKGHLVAIQKVKREVAAASLTKLGTHAILNKIFRECYVLAKYWGTHEKAGVKFTIRNAEGADAQKIINFMRYVDAETTFLIREPGEFEATYPLEKETELLNCWDEDPERLFLVAETADGEIAATCGCTYSSTRRRSRHLADIAIAVRESFWHMGLGRKLFQVQEAWCRENQVEKLCLSVDTLNVRALGLYLSQGFVIEGTLRKESKMADGSWRDMYRMAKFF